MIERPVAGPSHGELRQGTVEPPPLSPRATPVARSHRPGSSSTLVRGRATFGRSWRSSWSSWCDALRPRATGSGLASILAAAPSWLISLLFHMLVLLGLGLWFLPEVKSNALRLSAVFAESIGEQLEAETLQIGEQTEPVEQPVVTPPELPPVPEPLLAPETPPVADEGPTAAAELSVPDVGLALSGREAGRKDALLAAYGGNEHTESAVREGLEWLKRNQMRDGTWSLTGPYDDGGQIENPTAATAMALLAFQGAGHTHRGGSYQQAVKRGAAALLKMQDADGNFYQGAVAHHRLYSQAQAMIAVCELYGMTHDSQYRTAAERAVQYAVRIQDSLGGWRYQPGYDSDTSVSGWFMMGLQSARMAGLEVPSETLDRLSGYLDRAAGSDPSSYGYQPGMDGTFAMTAEGLLCRQYLGWPRSDERLLAGVNLLLAHPMDWADRDVYAWYYATQVLHHLEGPAWEQWNQTMRELLPAQQTMVGPERGSWSPHGDRWGSHAGRLYVTCLSLYMLEVYYRHLPIYAAPDALPAAPALPAAQP